MNAKIKQDFEIITPSYAARSYLHQYVGLGKDLILYRTYRHRVPKKYVFPATMQTNGGRDIRHEKNRSHQPISRHLNTASDLNRSALRISVACRRTHCISTPIESRQRPNQPLYQSKQAREASHVPEQTHSNQHPTNAAPTYLLETPPRVAFS